MQPDLLQQLRDIHLPADPDWWPPAPGWWMLAAAVVLGCLLGLRWAIDYQRRGRPVKRARRLYQTLYARLLAGEVSAESYLHQSNELLKRLLVHGLGRQAARPASGSAWLRILDQHYGTPEFSEGPGQILGIERFTRSPAIHTESLHALLASFFRRVRT